MDLSKYEIGISAGTFIYQGDLTPSKAGSYKTPGLNFNIFINRVLNSSFSLRTNLAFGKLRGDDSKYTKPEWRQQGISISVHLFFEVSEIIVWNILESDHTITPYVFGGAGLGFVKINRDWSNFNGEYFTLEPNVQSGLVEDADHRLPKLIPVLPLGAGIRYAFSKRISIVVESSYRLSYTDYLDGFSQSANPSRNDHFQNHLIGIIYKFGKRSGIDCPVVKN